MASEKKSVCVRVFSPVLIGGGGGGEWRVIIFIMNFINTYFINFTAFSEPMLIAEVSQE